MFILRWDKKSEILGYIKEMRKEKLELNEKRREINRGRRTNSKRRSKCKKDLNPKKRIIIKNDGRYLIYYDF